MHDTLLTGEPANGCMNGGAQYCWALKSICKETYEQSGDETEVDSPYITKNNI